MKNEKTEKSNEEVKVTGEVKPEVKDKKEEAENNGCCGSCS